MQLFTKDGITINIDDKRNELLSTLGKKTLEDRYLLPNETYQEAFARAAIAFADDTNHAQRLYDYASKLWFMFSTPVLSNGGTTRGLPISCMLNYVDDSCEGLTNNQTESAMLSRYGAGIGTDMSAIRSIGESTSTGNKTTGVIPFIKVIDSTMLAFQQGANRRGSAAIYLDISHPEVEEFIDVRKVTGDAARRSQYIHNALNIPDTFMKAVETDGDWNLVDPHSKRIKKTIKARDLWKKLMITRVMTGEPYFHFTDTSNKALPLALQMRGLRIHGSNLCNEIFLPTNKDRTAVCCLSSVNIEKYDEWKNEELFIEDLIRMLDNVLEVFIKDAPKALWRAVNSASRERSLGLGAMGFHGYLQSKGIPFESPMALGQTRAIFSKMFHEAKAASGRLAEERGEAPDMEGTGFRNAHVIAIAPNASSSYICGNASPGIEPFKANAFNADTLSGNTLIKNQYLEKVLDKYQKNSKDVWNDIALKKGSVQHLDFLTEIEKNVFKTAMELDQMWIVEHASVRQLFIDQGQSVNLFFASDANPNTISNVHYAAWKKGLKGLYYLRSSSRAQASTIGVVAGTEPLSDKEKTEDFAMEVEEGSECLACQG